jgi:hypothetical protein
MLECALESRLDGAAQVLASRRTDNIAARRRFCISGSLFISEHIMGHDIKTIKEARALLLQALRVAAPFFLSIELWLMVGTAFATVAGVWLAAMGDALFLLPIGLAGAYLVTRSVLHIKRILNWPFIA